MRHIFTFVATVAIIWGAMMFFDSPIDSINGVIVVLTAGFMSTLIAISDVLEKLGDQS